MPGLLDLATIGEGTPLPPPLLSINTLGPGSVRLGRGGQLIIVGWEHAGGQPPSWELADALLKWTDGPGGAVNSAGARAMIDGYRSEAGSIPALDLSPFRGAITSWLNYAYGQSAEALHAGDAQDRRHTARSMRHLLSHLQSAADLERLLDVALATAHE